ncbi:MAG: ABC-2 type transport system permease protein [Candidatus Poriferisodalaceae bacterium]|jgi:ABC-2 type transport system permease protein
MTTPPSPTNPPPPHPLSTAAGLAPSSTIRAHQAQILETGYRTYDGPRTGTIGAVRSVIRQGIRSTLGLGRPARHKIIPVATIVVAFLPATIFVGLTFLLPDAVADEVNADYSGYYGIITVSMILFAGFATPEALTADRRSGLLSLYLSTPLTRMSYLAARLFAVLAVLLIVTAGPLLLLLVGYTFQGLGPDGVVAWFQVLLRIIASGLLVSAMYTCVAFGVASFTDRRAIASTVIVMVLLLSGTATSIAVEGAELSSNLYLLNLIVVPFEAVFRIFGDRPDESTLGTAAVFGACAAWIIAGAGLAVFRYRRLRLDA